MPRARKSRDIAPKNTQSEKPGDSPQPEITIEAVNRLLELGKLLRSALTEEELRALSVTLNSQKREESVPATKPKRRSRKVPNGHDQAVKK